ncbi:MAG: Crp/Fnr family transcriptional regulator [Thermoplasmata archaeon]
MSASAKEELKGIVAGFAAAPLFAGLSERQIKRIARFAKVRDIPPETFVVKHGEKGIGFYLILEGQVQVRRSGKTLARLGPGDFFGELALFDDRTRSADVVTLGPTRVVVLSRWEFWGFASENPSVLRTILQEMSRRLQETAPSPSQ